VPSADGVTITGAYSFANKLCLAAAVLAQMLTGYLALVENGEVVADLAQIFSNRAAPAMKQMHNRRTDMNTRQRSRLMNLNRVLIFVLTLGGLLMDGLQIADLLGTLALVVWLWLPLCTRLEAYLLHRIDAKHGSAGTSPSM
jgi:hypothetical protein